MSEDFKKGEREKKLSWEVLAYTMRNVERADHIYELLMVHGSTVSHVVCHMVGDQGAMAEMFASAAIRTDRPLNHKAHDG